MDPDPFPILSTNVSNLLLVSSTNFSILYVGLAIATLLLIFCLSLAAKYVAQLSEEDLQNLEMDYPKTFGQLSNIYTTSNRLGTLFFMARLLIGGLFIFNLHFFLVTYELNFWLEVFITFSLLGLVIFVLPLLFSRYTPASFQFLMRVNFPLLQLVLPLANMLSAKEEAKPTSELSIADLETALPNTEEEQVKLSAANLNLYKQVLRFDQIKIRHVMRRKSELEGIKANYNFGEVLHKIKASNHSRLPVYDGNWTKILGIIHCKDLLPHTEQAQLDWKQYIRPIIYVQERDNAQAVLRKFQQTKNHMALVLSTSKRLVGLVTLEDITEEIIGEIEDE